MTQNVYNKIAQYLISISLMVFIPISVANDIPKTVTELAKNFSKDENITIRYFLKWNKYDVYLLHNKSFDNTIHGYPCYILYHKNKARFANINENTDIYYQYRLKQKNTDKNKKSNKQQDKSINNYLQKIFSTQHQ